ncbi:hypothetical protein SLS53_004240 [Cytospora paraplurivora]|uniref:Cytochrome P450 n=1 Tax=Cytospora paraplurivora TaxID=2898453 RepID=A0AAN9UB66_9PEZI
MLPESKLSSTAVLVDSVMGQYNGIATFLPGMAEELQAAMVEQLGQSTVENPVVCVAYELLLSFIHRISSVVFVGQEYCHNPIWTDAVTALPFDVEILKFLLLPFPAFLRRFIAPLIPQRRLGFDRKVISPIELSDGKTTLPRGATIAVPGGPMSRDSEYYDDPQRFDGFRFYRPDEDGDIVGSTTSQQDFTGIEPGNLSWGNGRFTCPGRWYAAAMIKLIVASLLLEYDISFPPGQTERPRNVKYDTEVHPDMAQKIILRRRHGA